MIVYDLKCGQGHRFESWFKNGSAFDALAGAGQVTCPDCGDTRITKAPMAPRLSRGGRVSSADEERRAEVASQVREALGEMRRQVETNCDYVGDKFPEEVRRMHYGEAEKRGVYGEASIDEAKTLADEGIEVAPLPWTGGPKKN